MPPFDHTARPGEAHYFSLLDNASEAIISFRAGEGRILEANAQAERLLGRPRDELVGAPFVDLFAPEHRDAVAWLVTQQDGAPLRLEDLSIRRPARPAPPAKHHEDRGPSAQGDSFPASKWQSAPDPFRVPELELEAADGPSGRRGASPQRDEVPVSLSCNWIPVDGLVVAQAILRDATATRQAQRDLESYAVQLEESVEARTRELQQSEERYRALFLQEQRRGLHLALINKVQQCALGGSDLDTFPHCCTLCIQEHFKRGDASFFLVDSSLPWSALDTSTSASAPSGPPSILLTTTRAPSTLGEEFDLVCVAQAGGHGLAAPPGTRVSSRAGLIGEAARRGEVLHRAGIGERVEMLPGVFRATKFEVAAPIMHDGRVLGVLSVQSEEPLAFDSREEEALGTAANIIASHLHSSRLFREIGELNAFHQTLINTMLHVLMVVDESGRLEIVNERLCTVFSVEREQILGQPFASVLGEDVIQAYHLDQVIEQVAQDGNSREIPEVHARTPDGAAVFDLRIFRVFFRGEPKAVILAINITIRWRKAHQLQLMHEIGRFFQASLDIDTLLHTVLTCITAGSSLGFNRAFVLLRDSYWQAREGQPEGDGDILLGAMALGPSSGEEAWRIWSELSQRNPTLDEILSVSQSQRSPASPLQHATRGLSFDLDEPVLQVLASIVREGRAALVHPCDLFPLEEDQHDEHCRQAAQVLAESTASAQATRLAMQAARKLFVAHEMAIAPLLSKDGVIGVVLADNLYSQDPINEDDVQLLDTLAQQAGLNIDNALAYQALQKAQRGLVNAERLAAVGDMAARVSHEIRNPLATIGGFARMVLKKPDQADKVKRNVGVIVDEVTRLEELLSDLLDMARPRQLQWEPHNANEVVSHALLLADADIKAAGVTVHKQLAPEMPLLLLDRSRLLQAILNIVRNGAQAMADKSGGKGNNEGASTSEGSEGAPSVITVSTRLDLQAEPPTLEIAVRDEGVGISERARKQIFNPFFSTKVSGSGLGLAVTRRILQDHGGDIQVESQENVGTTFYLRIPARAPESAQPESQAPAESEPQPQQPSE